ncbi:MAG: hypothetical protein ACYTG5_01940 [Planctomycetota bacterium]
MTKPMTFSLFFASALFTANLSIAQNEGSGDEGQHTVPGQETQAAEKQVEQNEAYEQGNGGDDDAFPITLEIRAGEDDSYGEVSLDEESFDDFLVAILISQSDATMDINDDQFLSQAQLLALTAGKGSSAGMNLPGGLEGLGDEVWVQVVVLDDQGELHAGPIQKLSETISEGTEGGDA